MRWYNHLYTGTKAKRHRFSIIQNIREERYLPGIYVITPPSNGNNVLDIHPVTEFANLFYAERQELLILGIAEGYQEALELAGTIVTEMYEKTGGFCLDKFLRCDEACHQQVSQQKAE